MLPQQLKLTFGTMKPRVETWTYRNRAILLGVDHQRGLLKIVLIVILVVAAFLMFATLSMMVTEKTSDIGILTALGGTPWSVMQVFLLCGLCITVAGLLLGVGMGCLSAVYLDDFNRLMRAWFDVDLFPTRVYNLDRVPHDLDPLWIAQVCGMALGVGAMVSALPAFRAARADPLASLRGT
jgi:lipoprotein-releasing system permease protein